MTRKDELHVSIGWLHATIDLPLQAIKYTDPATENIHDFRRGSGPRTRSVLYRLISTTYVIII